MFEHLDDPVELEPSTREQRQATMRRGGSLRRRRRTRVFAGAAAGVAAVIVGTLALPAALSRDTTVPPVAASPSASVEGPTFGPGPGVGTFWGSDPEVTATFTMPTGWEADGGWVVKSDSDLRIGAVFVDVENVYVDGCTWQLVSPQPGPTVDDLVAAFEKVPRSGVARSVTLDGFDGKQVDWTSPDYNEDDCTEGRFGIVEEEGSPSIGPNLWAQSPQQKNQIRILDVGGTRLGIITYFAPDSSAADRNDLDAIISSVRIR